MGKSMKIEKEMLFDPPPLPPIPRIYRYDKAFEVKFLTVNNRTEKIVIVINESPVLEWWIKTKVFLFSALEVFKFEKVCS